MTTLLASIEEKYSYDDGNGGAEDYGFIVFVSSSPETKKGMFPPIMTLCDYDIEAVGSFGLNPSRLSHIAELDLTDNLLSDWSEIFLLLETFSGLEFLNLSNNLLNEPIEPTDLEHSGLGKRPQGRLRMRKFVLNGNKVDWRSVDLLTRRMPRLEQLYLSTNNLDNPGGDEHQVFGHENLRQLYLSCNPVDSFDLISEFVGEHCPLLEMLSLAECPVDSVPSAMPPARLGRLTSLNLSSTRIGTWEEVDKLRRFPALTDLRLQRCPVLHEYTAHERRMLLIARLPNVKILNGGGRILDNEREDAERAFIRFYMDSAVKPPRYDELVSVHGKLDPLVNVNLQPETHVRVKVCHNETAREEVIEVYQTVQQFKALLQEWFKMPPQSMRLYYCDKDLVELAGPEEMKWPNKSLYTYNVQDGDKFIVDEKQVCGPQRSRTSSSSSYLGLSPGCHKLDSPGRFSFRTSPRNIGNFMGSGGAKSATASSASPRAKVSRKLFGATENKGKNHAAGN